VQVEIISKKSSDKAFVLNLSHVWSGRILCFLLVSWCLSNISSLSILGLIKGIDFVNIHYEAVFSVRLALAKWWCPDSMLPWQ